MIYHVYLHAKVDADNAMSAAMEAGDILGVTKHPTTFSVIDEYGDETAVKW